MKKKTLWLIIGISVALVIILSVVAKLKGDKGTKVAVEKATVHTIIETVTASGKIYPETEVKISPEVSGEITALTIEEGDSVYMGQLLVKINPAIYSSMVKQAQASLQETRARASNSQKMMGQSKANYEQAKANYERNTKLYKEKVISTMEYEQLKAQFLGAKASYEASQASAQGGQYSISGADANLTQAKENLRRTTIVAPTSGVISQLNVKLGERVVGTAQMAGTQILTIANMNRIEVRVEVSETDIAKVKIGDTTIVQADAYRNRKFAGIVSKVAVSSVSGSQQMSTDQVTNYTVHILILQDSYEDLSTELRQGKFVFKPGMSASVDIQTRKEANTLSIPVNAVTTRDWPDSIQKQMNAVNDDKIRQIVFVHNNKEVEIRDVSTGIQDNEYIQITDGLSEGEEVVVAPYGAIARSLEDKKSVRVVEKDLLYESKEDK